jgi:hypothetical protein
VSINKIKPRREAARRNETCFTEMDEFERMPFEEMFPGIPAAEKLSLNKQILIVQYAGYAFHVQFLFTWRSHVPS